MKRPKDRIAAIPTVYKGIQMRSRLEAKWANFFDACNITQWKGVQNRG